MSVLLSPDSQLVIAHRGNSAFAPENTMESLREGVALGADALEFDVHLSRDGVPVVIHDPTLDRTTGATGTVRDFTVSELKRVDAGYRFTRDGGRSFPWRGRGVTISTLDEVLAEFPATPFILEIKVAEASLAVKAALERAGAASRCIVGSFSDAALRPFRGSGIPRGAARGDVLGLFARAALPGGPPSLPFQALCIPPSFNGIPIPVLRFARMGRSARVVTHVWTVDDPRRAQRYWDGGVSGIITNDPATILAARGRAASARSSHSTISAISA